MLLLRGQRRQRQELGGLPNLLFARELHKDKSYPYAGTLPLYPDGPEASAIDKESYLERPVQPRLTLTDLLSLQSEGHLTFS